jgi:hypothetical protein
LKLYSHYFTFEAENEGLEINELILNYVKSLVKRKRGVLLNNDTLNFEIWEDE